MPKWKSTHSSTFFSSSLMQAQSATVLLSALGGGLMSRRTVSGGIVFDVVGDGSTCAVGKNWSRRSMESIKVLRPVVTIALCSISNLRWANLNQLTLQKTQSPIPTTKRPPTTKAPLFGGRWVWCLVMVENNWLWFLDWSVSVLWFSTHKRCYSVLYSKVKKSGPMVLSYCDSLIVQKSHAVAVLWFFGDFWFQSRQEVPNPNASNNQSTKKLLVIWHPGRFGSFRYSRFNARFLVVVESQQHTCHTILVPFITVVGCIRTTRATRPTTKMSQCQVHISWKKIL